MAASVDEQCSVLDGVLAVKKEVGWTSHDVVAKIRRVLGGVKVGHGGTLDPAATGVLPILIGRGTRIAEYLMEWEKEYRAVLRLGETTNTQDATGTVLECRAVDGVSDHSIRETVGQFIGSIQQIPPMYSALKIDGVPLYKSARAGKTLERKARPVEIHALHVISIDGRDVRLRVVCSKGTYVRTLCADIGEALGVGGHLLSLERSRVGPLSIEHALTVEEVATFHALGRLSDRTISLARALEHLPAVEVDGRTADRVRHGASVPSSGYSWVTPLKAGRHRAGSPVRILDASRGLLAVGRQPSEEGGTLSVDKVLVDVDTRNSS